MRFCKIIVPVHSQSSNILIQLHEICAIRIQCLHHAHQSVRSVCHLTDASRSSRGVSGLVARNFPSEQTFGFYPFTDLIFFFSQNADMAQTRF